MILHYKAEHARSNNGNGINLEQILVFLLLAFIIPLICVVLIKYIRCSNVFKFVLFGIEAASPSLAAVLTVIIFESGSEFRKFLQRCYVDYFSMKLVLIGLLLPAVVIAASKLLYWLIYGVAPTFGSFSPKKILIVCWALVAEELGWRGFLQDKLGIYLNELILPFVLGLIWASWHYHFFISGEMSVPILLFTLGCIADSYLFFVLTKAAKGNIAPVSVLHFSENLCLNLFLINPQYNNGSAVPYLFYVTGFLIVAAISFAVMLKRKIIALQ